MWRAACDDGNRVSGDGCSQDCDTTYCLLPTMYYLVPTTYYPLPTTYYLVLTTYYPYILPTTYYLAAPRTVTQSRMALPALAAMQARQTYACTAT